MSEPTQLKRRIVSIDTESDYSKEVSITTLGTYHYLRHPECDIYLVTIVADDGFEYAGSLEDAPWEEISGPNVEWLHHNAGHEDEVFLAAKEKGQMPKHIAPAVVHCTADLTAYLGYPRSLKEACHHLLNKEISKETRDQMKGKRWRNMAEDFKAQVIEYGMDDARYPLQIWQQHSHKWPEWERELSRLTRRMGQTGVLVDKPYLEECVGNLRRLMWEAEKQIPWASSGAALSYPKLCAQCRQVGIQPPPSLAMDDEHCIAWENKYGAEYPWVFAMRTKRRANTALKRWEAMLNRIRPDGRVSAPLAYCGAHTKRGAGMGGINFQNASREEMLADEMKYFNVAREGVEIRRTIIAPKGYKIAAPDLSAIEPRVLATLCGDTEMLDMLEKGFDVYEAHARSSMNYTRPEPLKSLVHIPEFNTLRVLAKIRVLQLGYGAGWKKLWDSSQIELSPAELKTIFGSPVTEAQRIGLREAVAQRKDAMLTAEWKRLTPEEETNWVNAWLVVSDFRAKNPKIVALWRKMQALIERSVGEDMVVNLPSGNKLTYRGVHTAKKKGTLLTKEDGGREYYGYIPRQGKMLKMHLYGAKIVENACQSVARDIFSHGLLRLGKANKKLLMQVHDEAVLELPIDECLDECLTLMKQRPSWMPNTPLEAAGSEGPNYAI